MKKAFLIHGHSNTIYEIESFLRNEFNIESIIAMNIAALNRTFIEHIEDLSNVDIAIALWTKDDFGNKINLEKKLPRARQNVIFETGYFFGLLSRSNVIVIIEDNIELPSDYFGILYVKLSEWKEGLRKNIKRIIKNSQIIFQYQDKVVSYFPFKNNLVDISSNSTIVNCINTSEELKHPTFNQDGIKFDGNFVIQSKIPQLPTLKESRSISMWIKFSDIPSTFTGEVPKFLFSYGEMKHGNAFGLYYGLPFFEGSFGLDAGLRIFYYCNPYYWNKGYRNCDSEPFCTVSLSKWYHVLIVYNGIYVKTYVNNQLLLTLERNCSTISENSFLNIGGFLPNHEKDYQSYNFRGYIREFIIFNTELHEEDVSKIYLITQKLLL